MLIGLIAKQKDSSSQITTGKNALTPMLWMVASVFGFAVPSYYIFQENMIIVIFISIIVSLVLLCGMFSYLYLLFNDPEKLQSEHYQINYETIKLLKTKDSFNSSEVKLLQAVNNPKSLGDK